MKIPPLNTNNFTAPLTYLRGAFGQPDRQIRYYSAVVPLAQAASAFRLLEELPESERMDWSVSELFQRDIAWDRIDEGLLPYLRNDSHPQFFNSLTVALLRRSFDGLDANFEPAPDYSGLDGESECEELIAVKGIVAQTYSGTSGDAGRIRWDQNEVVAVAVDGQHRLAAMKELVKVQNQRLYADYSVPVIFLIPDPKFGFSPANLESAGAGGLSAVRKVFIDLNKNARKVSDSRRYLLDDFDIAAVCLRQMITDRLGDASEGRLPLAAVNWLEDDALKFESGPFLTTVLLLHMVIRDGLNLSKLDPDPGELEASKAKLVDDAQLTFGLTTEQAELLAIQVDRCSQRGSRLTLAARDIAMFRDGFERNWKPHLVRLLSGIDPYRKLIALGTTTKIYSPALINLYSATTVQEGQRSEERVKRIESLLEEADPEWTRSKRFTKPLNEIDDLKLDRWAFKVVFQRALCEAFFELAGSMEAETGFEDNRSGLTSSYIESLNCLLSDDSIAVVASEAGDSRPKAGGDYFWSGICYRPAWSINHTNAGRKSLARWLKIWFCLWSAGERIKGGAELRSSHHPAHKAAVRLLSTKPAWRSFESVAQFQMGETAAGDDAEVEKACKKLIDDRIGILGQIVGNHLGA
jgi:DGQHR domain-containing protein